MVKKMEVLRAGFSPVLAMGDFLFFGRFLLFSAFGPVSTLYEAACLASFELSQRIPRNMRTRATCLGNVSKAEL